MRGVAPNNGSPVFGRPQGCPQVVNAELQLWKTHQDPRGAEGNPGIGERNKDGPLGARRYPQVYRIGYVLLPRTYRWFDP